LGKFTREINEKQDEIIVRTEQITKRKELLLSYNISK